MFWFCNGSYLRDLSTLFEFSSQCGGGEWCLLFKYMGYKYNSTFKILNFIFILDLLNMYKLWFSVKWTKSMKHDLYMLPLVFLCYFVGILLFLLFLLLFYFTKKRLGTNTLHCIKVNHQSFCTRSQSRQIM